MAHLGLRPSYVGLETDVRHFPRLRRSQNVEKEFDLSIFSHELFFFIFPKIVDSK